MRADVAVEHFGVIADPSDDTHGPVAGEAEWLAEIAVRSHQPLDRGLLRLQRVIDCFRADAKLLGIDHREVDPLHDIEPLHVILPDGSAAWRRGGARGAEHVTR